MALLEKNATSKVALCAGETAQTSHVVGQALKQDTLKEPLRRGQPAGSWEPAVCKRSGAQELPSLSSLGLLPLSKETQLYLCA